MSTVETETFVEHQSNWLAFCAFLYCCFPDLTVWDMSRLHVAAMIEHNAIRCLTDWSEWGHMADEWSAMTGVERQSVRLSAWKPSRAASTTGENE